MSTLSPHRRLRVQTQALQECLPILREALKAEAAAGRMNPARPAWLLEQVGRIVDAQVMLDAVGWVVRADYTQPAQPATIVVCSFDHYSEREEGTEPRLRRWTYELKGEARE